MAPSTQEKENQVYRPTCKRRLQNNFEDCDGEDSRQADRSILSVLSLNDNARKALRNGAERLTKTFNSVRTSIGTITQKFRASTRRRQILEEGPMTPNCATPHTFSKQVLGRTPTKLYSPFGIDTTPVHAAPFGKENKP